MKESKVEGVIFKQGMLVLTTEVMVDLFRPCVQSIVEHVQKLLEEPQLSGTSYILMVGGFSESKILQQAVIQQFGDGIKVLVPIDAGLCMLKGAVLYGHDPQLISNWMA